MVFLLLLVSALWSLTPMTPIIKAILLTGLLAFDLMKHEHQ
jgi:hypothetical protein